MSGLVLDYFDKFDFKWTFSGGGSYGFNMYSTPSSVKMDNKRVTD